MAYILPLVSETEKESQSNPTTPGHARSCRVTLKNHHALPYPILVRSHNKVPLVGGKSTTEERNRKRRNSDLAHVRFPLETRRRPFRRCAKKAQKRGRRREVEVRRLRRGIPCSYIRRGTSYFEVLSY